MRSTVVSVWILLSLGFGLGYATPAHAFPFGRIISAPFRAFGNLFRGIGRRQQFQEQQRQDGPEGMPPGPGMQPQGPDQFGPQGQGQPFNFGPQSQNQNQNQPFNFGPPGGQPWNPGQGNPFIQGNNNGQTPPPGNNPPPSQGNNAVQEKPEVPPWDGGVAQSHPGLVPGSGSNAPESTPPQAYRPPPGVTAMPGLYAGPQVRLPTSYVPTSHTPMGAVTPMSDSTGLGAATLSPTSGSPSGSSVQSYDHAASGSGSIGLPSLEDAGGRSRRHFHASEFDNEKYQRALAKGAPDFEYTVSLPGGGTGTCQGHLIGRMPINNVWVCAMKTSAHCVSQVPGFSMRFRTAFQNREHSSANGQQITGIKVVHPGYRPPMTNDIAVVGFTGEACASATNVRVVRQSSKPLERRTPILWSSLKYGRLIPGIAVRSQHDNTVEVHLDPRVVGQMGVYKGDSGGAGYIVDENGELVEYGNLSCKEVLSANDPVDRPGYVAFFPMDTPWAANMGKSMFSSEFLRYMGYRM